MMSNKQYLQQNNPNMSLWMGDIDESMDERFIKTSFNLMGFHVTQVKIVRNRNTGQPVGYGFISFESEELAQKVLRDVNGQQVPNASDGKKFRLNTTSANRDENEFSIYVGDLSPEVDDLILLASFSAKFASTCSAKVMSINGQSRRFGFVRFSSENDYRNALSQSSNLNIPGLNSISVRAAKPRRPKPFQNSYKRNATQYGFEAQVPQQTKSQEAVYATDMSNPYANAYPVATNPYVFYQYVPMNGIQYSYDGQSPYLYGQPMFAQQYYPYCDNMAYPSMASHTFVDHGHNQCIDTDKLNEEMIAKNDDLYLSIENTRWTSSVDCDKESKVQ